MNKLKHFAFNVGSCLALVSILFITFIIFMEFPRNNHSWLDYIFWIIEVILSICYLFYTYTLIDITITMNIDSNFDSYDFIDLRNLKSNEKKNYVLKSYYKCINEQRNDTK